MSKNRKIELWHVSLVAIVRPTDHDGRPIDKPEVKTIEVEVWAYTPNAAVDRVGCILGELIEQRSPRAPWKG